MHPHETEGGAREIECELLPSTTPPGSSRSRRVSLQTPSATRVQGAAVDPRRRQAIKEQVVLNELATLRRVRAAGGAERVGDGRAPRATPPASSRSRRVCLHSSLKFTDAKRDEDVSRCVMVHAYMVRHEILVSSSPCHHARQVKVRLAPSTRHEIAPPRAAAHRHGRADLARWPRRRARAIPAHPASD